MTTMVLNVERYRHSYSQEIVYVASDMLLYEYYAVDGYGVLHNARLHILIMMPIVFRPRQK